MSKVLTLKEKILYWRGKYFPERQLFLRSEGRVRFLTISTNAQVLIASAASVFLIWGSVTTYAYLTHDMRLEQKNQTISNMSVQYQTLSSDFSTLEVEIERRARQLEDRQKFLEEVIGPMQPAPLIVKPKSKKTDDTSDEAAAKAKTSLLDVLMGSSEVNAGELSSSTRRAQLMSRLQQAEYKQQRLARHLTIDVNNKLQIIDRALQPTLLSQDDLTRQWQSDTQAMGGPYSPDIGFEPIFTEQDNQNFSELLESWQRLEIVTMVLDSFPVGEPVEEYYLSSRFGRRKDPLKHTWANHPGLDMAGWPGTPILATAPGKVVHSGWFGPYGKMIEIEHGNGFKTRYGHMSKLLVKKGEIVDLGKQIGEMGKTGRVTGSHLHYEIWFEGEVRDPLPFLKAANDVLKIQGRHEKNSSS
ncbi:M23 family metallopeptidase [Kordiimonas pumila]|uniref:Peptidoglycan DD-metalloendopeptidase family protein n=1 Tax=Kordiimonas pumila TaxID=2161677 RepID=A0ABV7D2A4_9PROT|nr:M23 family metallopeptidase [Kordiimonas pumila]